jgi:hypothetical protein
MENNILKTYVVTILTRIMKRCFTETSTKNVGNSKSCHNVFVPISEVKFCLLFQVKTIFLNNIPVNVAFFRDCLFSYAASFQ